MVVPIPLSGSDIRIYSSVRFARDYSHVRWFTTAAERNTWFSNKTTVAEFQQVSFIRHSNMQGVYKCNKQLETLQNATYLSFDNEGQTYYCFIDNLEYENDHCTIIYFTVDVFQTNLFKLTFLPSLIEREHCQRYLANGQPVVNTIPEGLNYGEDYITNHVERIAPYPNIFFMVIVCKRPFHLDATNEITPFDNGIPQGLTYYIHPFGYGYHPSVKIAGVNVELSEPDELLKMLYNQGDAVNNVVSIYITDNTGLSAANMEDDYGVEFASYQIEQVEFGYEEGFAFTLYVKQARTYQKYLIGLGDKYNNIIKYDESKLLMYPYTVYVLTDLKGNQIEIKPELIQTNELQIAAWGSLGTSNKVSYHVTNYKHTYEYGNNGAGYSEGIISETPATIPVLSDYLSAYLQGNVNSIQSKMNGVFVNGVFDAVAGVGGIAASAATKNVGGVANGAIGVGQNFSNSLLNFQAIQAQLKDIRNIPPNMQNQGNNVNFDYGNDLHGLYLFKKQIKPEYATILSNYFKLYGYKVNQLKMPNLKTRERFNYVKMVEPNIIANVAAEQLQLLKMIFSNGVTLWHVDDMLNYTPDNNEI